MNISPRLHGLLAGALLATLSAVCSSAAPAVNTKSRPPEGPVVRDRRAELERLAALQRNLAHSFADADYAAAAAVCHDLIALSPDAPDPRYNLACALAQLGKTAEAMQALRAAAARGWTHSRHTLTDRDLASLRESPDFVAFIAELQSAEKKLFDGKEFPGARTITGDPAGGLRYRLRIDPAAGKEHPARLVVWMHPTGIDMNEAAESLVPVLLPRGFALLVFTEKDFSGWSGADLAGLHETLAALAANPDIDARRPILMGYSTGGQMAVQLWLSEPQRWGGLILDAAYPLDLTKTAPDGAIAPLVLPAAGLLPQAPMFVLVGEDDPGSALWKKAEPAWRKAGAALTLLYVPARGRAWLFDPAKMRDLGDWLLAVPPAGGGH